MPLLSTDHQLLEHVRVFGLRGRHYNFLVAAESVVTFAENRRLRKVDGNAEWDLLPEDAAHLRCRRLVADIQQGGGNSDAGLSGGIPSDVSKRGRSCVFSDRRIGDIPQCGKTGGFSGIRWRAENLVGILRLVVPQPLVGWWFRSCKQVDGTVKIDLLCSTDRV